MDWRKDIAMRTINNGAAVISPCRNCQEFLKARRRKESTHPDCVFMCKDANLYLKKIGIPPHLPERKQDLSKLYPPKQNCNFTKNYKLCTPEQYQEVHRRLVEIMGNYKGKRAALAEKIGISVTLMNSIIRGNEKRTSESTYQKIMGVDCE